jgi:2-aminoadipate transaminase
MTLPDIQPVLRPGMVEYGWGDPSPDLLPAVDLARAAEIALRQRGPQALTYGAEQGPGHLIEALRGWLARQEGKAPPEQEIFITGGVSQALDLICTLFTRPGDTVLVESPVYHLALRIFRDHGLEVVPAAAREDGLRADELAKVLESLHAHGLHPRFLYTVPTFNNPTGMTMPLAERQAVVAVAQRAELLVLEDDVYHALWFDAPPPASMYTLAPDVNSGPTPGAEREPAPAGTIVRLGSFSKILAPGLRLGWLTAPPDIVRKCTQCGLLDSGGGVGHFAAHVVAEFIELGLLDGHVEQLRRAYGRRRDALLDALARHLSPACSWRAPGGGFFMWLRLPEGYHSQRFLRQAETAGVSYVPGGRFYAGAADDRCARLAFSMLPLEELEDGVRRLASLLDRNGLAATTGVIA